jgi:hypothetical protein
MRAGRSPKFTVTVTPLAKTVRMHGAVRRQNLVVGLS